MTDYPESSQKQQTLSSQVDEYIELKKNWIVVDFDKTISDDNHRVDLIKAEGYDDYHRALITDAPIIPVCVPLISLSDSNCFRFLGCTSRDEKWRVLTEKWLHQHDMDIFDTILMRPEGDYSRSPDCKMELLNKFFGEQGTTPQDAILFAIDDREDVVERYRNEGIYTMQVNGGLYKFAKDIQE